MAIVFATRVFAQTLIDGSNYYSDPSLNLLMASAEKYCIQLNTSNVSGTTPTLDVRVQSNNGTGVYDVGTKILASIAIASGTVAFGYMTGLSAVVGRETRLQVTLFGTNPKAYVEIWLTGRDAH